MRALNRPSAYVTASLLRLTLAVTLNVVLLWLGFKVYAVLFSSLAVTVAMAAYMGIFSLSGIRWWLRFDRALMLQFVRYSAPLGISGLSMLVINYGDRFFLQRSVSLADIGIYSLAYKLGMLVTYIQMPFDVYWRSQMFTIVREPGGGKVYVRIATYLALGLTFVVVLFALFADPVIRIMTPSAFWPAAQYVPWIAAAYVIRTVGAHFRCVFLLEGQTGKELHVTAAGAVTCLASYAVLIPRFGLAGAVASTVLGFSVMLVLGLWQAQKQRFFPFEYRRMLILAAVAACVIALFHAAQPKNIWTHAAVALAFAGMYPALLLFMRFLYPDESHALHDALTAKARPWIKTPAATPNVLGGEQ
jgi:O-antigen/teichoic acid export membrane protein